VSPFLCFVEGPGKKRLSTVECLQSPGGQIEIWFGLLTRRAIRRGTSRSVKQLVTTIANYITNWNADCKPFDWTADADTILAKVRWIESEVHKLTGH
jgi:hypothetical protein